MKKTKFDEKLLFHMLITGDAYMWIAALLAGLSFRYPQRAIMIGAALGGVCLLLAIRAIRRYTREFAKITGEKASFARCWNKMKDQPVLNAWRFNIVKWLALSVCVSLGQIWIQAIAIALFAMHFMLVMSMRKALRI